MKNWATHFVLLSAVCISSGVQANSSSYSPDLIELSFSCKVGEKRTSDDDRITYYTWDYALNGTAEFVRAASMDPYAVKLCQKVNYSGTPHFYTIKYDEGYSAQWGQMRQVPQQPQTVCTTLKMIIPGTLKEAIAVVKEQLMDEHNDCDIQFTGPRR